MWNETSDVVGMLEISQNIVEKEKKTKWRLCRQDQKNLNVQQ